MKVNGKFIAIGGHDTGSRPIVAEFTETGEVTYLPRLQTGRYVHACSQFVDNNGETVSFQTEFHSISPYMIIVKGFACHRWN